MRATGLKATLRLLSTTDLHATIWPFDYAANRPMRGTGLAMLATRIAAARREAAARGWACLLFDSGDFLQGSALADQAALGVTDRTNGTRRRRERPHPMLAAMNALGYAAGALGNHDFNYGLPLVEHAIAEADFPLLCANLVRRIGTTPLDDLMLSQASTVIDVTPGDGLPPLRVGVLGVAPPQILQWDKALLGGRLAARGIVDAAWAHATELRRNGADLVVALCHSGIGRSAPLPFAEDAARAVAELDAVDVVLAGHSHRRLVSSAATAGPDGPGGDWPSGTPMVMAGAMGRDLGVIDLGLRHEDGAWQLADARAELRPVAPDTIADPAVLSLTERAHKSVLRQLNGVIGHTRDRLHALFPLAGHAPALQFVAEAQAWRARALVAGTSLAGLPLVSAVASYSSGGVNDPEDFVDIPPGPLRQRHLAQLSPYPNRLSVLEIDGSVLRLWLERAAAVLQGIPPGSRDRPLHDPAEPAYNFDVVFGLSYKIDLSQPARIGGIGPGRIVELTHRGQAVAPDARFAIATNSYRAAGGGRYNMVPDDTTRVIDDMPLSAMLADYVAATGEVALAATPNWSFAPIAATAIVRSAPKARLDVYADPTRRMEALAASNDGFTRFRLHL